MVMLNDTDRKLIVACRTGDVKERLRNIHDAMYGNGYSDIEFAQHMAKLLAQTIGKIRNTQSNEPLIKLTNALVNMVIVSEAGG